MTGVESVNKKMHFSRIGIIFGAFVLGLIPTSNVKADPVTFSNVVALQNGSTRVALANNSGITLLGPQIDFLVDISGATPAAGVHTLRLTFQEANLTPVIQTFRVPLFDGLPADYSQLFAFQAQNPSFAGTPVVLTVALLNDVSGEIIQRQMYEFKVAQAVPEPATSSLLVLGVMGMLARRKSRLKRL
jgi:hypothetical protein